MAQKKIILLNPWDTTVVIDFVIQRASGRLRQNLGNIGYSNMLGKPID